MEAAAILGHFGVRDSQASWAPERVVQALGNTPVCCDRAWRPGWASMFGVPIIHLRRGWWSTPLASSSRTNLGTDGRVG